MVFELLELKNSNNKLKIKKIQKNFFAIVHNPKNIKAKGWLIKCLFIKNVLD